MQQLGTNLPSIQERLLATLLARATVAHLGGGFPIGATVKRAHNFIDLAGQKFGRLTAIRVSDMHSLPKRLKWECKCDCGNIAFVDRSHLTRLETQSCGCLLSETLVSRAIHKHCRGYSKTKEYQSWSCMLQRCYNPKNISYKYYGAKGITVCGAWRKSFPQFLDDMGKCPDGCTLDRIRSGGNYTPSNCRWGTDEQQRSNRSDNRLITFNGKTLTASQWDAEMGFKKSTIVHRIYSGWTEERAITQPVRKAMR